MGMALKLQILAFLCSFTGFALGVFNDVIPTLDEDVWWATGTATDVDTSLREFKIEWSDEFLADLKYRLVNRRPLQPPLEGAAFQNGFNTNTLNEILDYWADGYDFEARLEYLNQYDQFKTNIDGLDIHFLWVKPETKSSRPQDLKFVRDVNNFVFKTNLKVLPMIVLHGWPSSFREYLDSVQYLTTEQEGFDFVYELIIPSLPGFGFSDGPVRSGMGVAEVAVLMHKLMTRLGYDQYYVAGGDYGGVIGNALATIKPDHVLGYHTHTPFAIGSFYAARLAVYENLPEVLEEENTRARTYPLSAKNAFWDSESGYSHQQRSRPDTIGFPLTDSPAGLAAYTLEKFSTGEDIANLNLTDGGFSHFNIDNMLDNVMIYWTSSCITTSVRYYKEFYSSKTASYNINLIPITTPVWIIQAYKELIVNPAKFMVDKYLNLLEINYSGVGGHYYALMEPELYAEDVFNAGQAFQEFHSLGDVSCLNFTVDVEDLYD